jgi:hypothetical protein
VLLGLVSAMLWRWHAASQPEFALAQVAVAIERSDDAKLAYYADVNAFTDQIVAQTVDWLAAHRGPDDVIAVAEVEASGDRQSRIREAKGALGDRLGRTMASAIESASHTPGPVGPRVVQAFIEQAPLSAILDGDHLDVRSVDRPLIEDDGQTATIPVTLRHRELVVDTKIGLVLSHEGARWRLVGLSGLAGALNAIDHAQSERIAIANRPRESELAELLTVGAPHVERVAPRRSARFYRVRVPLTNRSPASIAAVTLALTGRGSDDDHATLLSVEHPIPPGATSTEIWQFDEAANRGTHLGSLLARPERLALYLRSVVVDSAGGQDTVKVLRRYEDARAEGN